MCWRSRDARVLRYLLAWGCGCCLGAARDYKINIKSNSFRPEGRVTFVLAKVTKTVRSRREPPLRGGTLRSSPEKGRRPNGLATSMWRACAFAQAPAAVQIVPDDLSLRCASLRQRATLRPFPTPVLGSL